jgi:hypothetical protein
MPRGKGIYENEPRDQLGKHTKDSDASEEELAPDDTARESTQEPTD